MKQALLLVALAVALPARAADKPLRLSGGPKSEDALRKFVTSDKRLKAKIDDAAAREAAFLAENRDSDLRDAVSDGNGEERFQHELANASGNDRARVLEQLPGLKVPTGAVCATLSACATPELSADVTDAELLPDAVRRLVRPWMLLQQARGSELELSPVSAEGDAFLTVTLKDSDAAPLTLNVSPRLLGGFKLWFDQPLVLASLYDRERSDALKSVR